MRYQHSIPQSGELLRMAIPLMARHKAPYHPITYTVWYEYLAGLNPELNVAIDQHTRERGPLDDEAVTALYREHVLDDWSRRALGIQAEMGSVLDTFDTSAHTLEEETQSFDAHWASLANLLRSPADLARLAELRRATLEAGSRVQACVGDLRRELAASLGETRALRSRMNDLHAQVLTDPLTGTYNRRGLDARWQDIVQSSGGTPECAAVMIDIDHFKNLNDRFGHLFGDQVLKAVAEIVRRSVRSVDVVSRMGGEEFVILLPGMSAKQAQFTAEAIRVTVERAELRNKMTGAQAGRVTISSGVVTLRPGEALEAMIERADAAMYRAKASGRNAVMAEA